MTHDVGAERSVRVGLVRRPTLPMFAVCVGALLPRSREAQSGILDEGKDAFALAVAGLLIYAISAAQHSDLSGYGALGAIVVALAAVAWLVAARRAT
jgi:hypothetical protein